MPNETLSAKHLAYLQQVGFVPTELSAGATATAVSSDRRRMYRIGSVGRMEKAAAAIARYEPDKPMRLPSEDIMIGLYGYKIPLAFYVSGSPEGITVNLGTWSPKRENISATTLDARLAILNSTLSGLYPAVELSQDPSSAEAHASQWPDSGFVLGVPTAKPPDALDEALPLDRLIRALSAGHWAFLVLADPVDETLTSKQQNIVVNEIMSVQSELKAELVPRPLAEQYIEGLTMTLKAVTQGQTVGAWRTAVYLLGDVASYSRLASVWRSIFSGDQSFPEPVRVWDSRRVADLAVNWALPDADAPSGPGYYRRLFQYQTLLTSSQLAAYIHLPQLETSGFAIKAVPHFDVVPPAVKGDHVLSLGPIVQWNQPTTQEYKVNPKSLTRHAFVPGITGSGKTNTIFHLLKQTAPLGIPFLVIEPAKTEYRALLNDPTLAGHLNVFTPGNEAVSPFRVNPFEVVSWPKTSVGVHLDLLRSVFNASFGMWTPLPQVLEQCLHGVYKDRGWDITTNTNRRWDTKSEIAATFPTLSDLVAKVDEVTRQLGYEEKITADIHAALHTRINGLRAGGKGRMLDVQRSLPMELLLQSPTILELEGMGDDDDKAFVMGLMLIRLAEYRRAAGEKEELQHLLIIEEAHRLLGNLGGRSSQEEADPRGKAVETFTNVLSEIRAYGQGVIVADQVPVKLAPDVIKNTNLKVAHKVVARDDREVLAGAMHMDDRQTQALSNLTIGQAAVYALGDDAPVLVKVPVAKDQPDQPIPNGDQVAARMAKALESHKRILHPLSDYFDMSAPTVSAASDAARALIDTPTFRREFVRFVTSVTEDDGAFDRLWDQLLTREQADRPHGIDERVMRRCLLIYAAEWLADRRGAQSGWSYADTAELEANLRGMLLARLEEKDWVHALAAFRACMNRLHQRSFEPYVGCARICTQGPLCMYRYAVADIVAAARSESVAKWEATHNQEGPSKNWEVALNVAYEVIEQQHTGPVQTAAVRRIGLCFVQHMLADHFPEMHEVHLRNYLDETKKMETGGETGGRNSRQPRETRT